MARYESVLDAIGGTPLIRLRRVGGELAVPIYVKAEFLNPGGSVKDRAALAMVLAAERSGELREGGVIVEGTSGNTGVGLAVVAAQRGYRLIVTAPDKTSDEKLAILRALGAEVVVTSGGLPRQHPDHVANLARRIADGTPGAWFANQYDNPANPAAHRDTTGPEIWRDTEGRVTHFVAGVGTGGTVTGTAQFLKRASGGAVTVVGADPHRSTYGGGDGSPYYVEAVGHYLHPETVDDVWPQSYDPAIVDRLERVGDRESFDAVGRLAREEGLLAGPSSGTALAAALRIAEDLDERHLVVVLLPDSGRSYLSKNFDPRWMSRWGFDDETTPRSATVAAVYPPSPEPDVPAVTVGSTARESLAQLAAVPNLAPSQRIPVVLARRGRVSLAAGDVVGSTSVTELQHVVDAGGGGEALGRLGPVLPSVGMTEPVGDALARLAAADRDVLVLHEGQVVGTLSRDVLERFARDAGHDFLGSPGGLITDVSTASPVSPQRSSALR